MTAAVQPVSLYAAGSLSAALGEVAEDITEAHGVEVNTTFGPSGLLRERIETEGHVFASANMAHPLTLAAAGRGWHVVLFARNRLCALAAPGVTGATLLGTMRSGDVRVGTSTPGADPSGDYAWALFDRAEAVRPGAAEVLKAKAMQLTDSLGSAAARGAQRLRLGHGGGAGQPVSDLLH